MEATVYFNTKGIIFVALSFLVFIALLMPIQSIIICISYVILFFVTMRNPWEYAKTRIDLAKQESPKDKILTTGGLICWFIFYLLLNIAIIFIWDELTLFPGHIGIFVVVVVLTGFNIAILLRAKDEGREAHTNYCARKKIAYYPRF